MLHASKSRRAESLIETMIAITVIVIATAASLGLTRMSLQGNDVIGEKVVALNLALESIEAMRNYRDTNYLRYASNTDDCWNKIDPGDVSLCSDADAIGDVSEYFFTREYDSSGILFEWIINKYNSGSSIDGYIDQYTIAADLDDDASTADEEIPFFAETGLSTPFTTVDEKPYRRYFKISNIKTDPDDANQTVSFDMTVIVEWEDGDSSISLTKTISHVN